MLIFHDEDKAYKVLAEICGLPEYNQVMFVEKHAVGRSGKHQIGDG